MTAVRDLVVIEAPGKVRTIESALRGAGLAVDVMATGGHFCEHDASLWPLGIAADGSEPGRIRDPIRATMLQSRGLGRRVLIATDADQEGDVIARDIAEVVRGGASAVLRMRVSSLDRESIRAAFLSATPFEVAGALPGDARRIVDRWIGHTFSRPAQPVGRVSSALLRVLADADPVIGHVTLTLPCEDGGPPFVAQVPVTAATCDAWEARRAAALPAVPVAATETETRRRPWTYGELLLHGVLARPQSTEPLVEAA